MIQRLSHHTVYVLDQDQAKDFYVGKLGFELKMDFDMGKFRWLTVTPKGQPDLQLILMPIVPGPEMDEARCEQLRALLREGRMPSGAFHTADCRKTYEELSAKGVEFKQLPTERFYGIEAIVKDPFGNWYSLTQPTEQHASGAKG
jgi:catechol 2,3-dioxygenase-like lactoylglutathione lyase family enzyme